MFNMEMNSKNELYIGDCLGILAYSDDNISLEFEDFSLKVSGSELSMISYANGEMYIEGDILRIEFESLEVSEDAVADKKHCA